MATPVTNFGKVTVSTGYDAAATSIVLSTGHGSRLPSTFPYPLTWWDASTYSDPADDPNREIVIVTNRVGDTLTVTRAGESTTASVKNVAGKTYKMVLGITKAMWDGLSTNSLSQSFRGLHLRTHPDSDKAAAQVMLVSAEAIVMDDGEEISNWSRVTAAITASGAGGLDTGAEINEAWYKVWAIYNRNSDTKNLLLQKAKDYTLDEDASAGEDGAHALRDATARTKLAQGFQVDNAGPCEFVDVKIYKTGTPTGNFWFTLESNSGGVPSGTALATSDKYDISRLPTGQVWFRIMFRNPATLSAATQYHLVLQGDFTVSAVNYMSWRADTTAAAYSRGSKAAYDGTTWTADTDDDFMAQIYVTTGDVAVVMPSGYTSKAHIGWVRNDGSGNFMDFVQHGNHVLLGVNTVPASSSRNYLGSAINPTIFQAASAIPPTPCWVSLRVDGSVATMGVVVCDAANLLISDVDPSGFFDYKYTPGAGLAGDRHLAVMDPVLIERQGVKIAPTSNTVYAWVGSFDW